MPTPSTHGRGKGRRRPAAQRRDDEAQTTRLEERTREELYDLARRLRIPGCDDLDKTELIEAIRRR